TYTNSPHTHLSSSLSSTPPPLRSTLFPYTTLFRSLLTRSFIQIHYLQQRGIFKICHMWVVKGNMRILSNSHTYNIYRIFSKQIAILLNLFYGFVPISIQIKDSLKRYLIEDFFL